MTPVPGNRWDLLPAPDAPPAVSVIVTYFEQRCELARVLAGLAAQRGPVDLREVIVVDDGSARPPDVPSDLGVPVIVARQEDRGCRPAAARNIGAALATGDVLVFFDGDTVPAPDAVARLAALPAVSAETLVVGRREYADLDGWSPAAFAAWLAAPHLDCGPRGWERPAWLDEAYAATQDLLDIDHRSYQLVIGAVMAMSRHWFDELGGFDASIDCYGGEDWEIAYRAYCAGGLLAHVPDAVGWHHGPDWRGRSGDGATKNPERLALVRTIPGRDDPVLGPFAQILARVTGDGPDDDVIATVAGLLSSGGNGIRVHVVRPNPTVAGVCEHDPRVTFDELDPTVVARSLVQLEIHAPVHCSPGALDEILELTAPAGSGRVEIVDAHGRVARATATRAIARARRWAGSFADADVALAALFGAVEVPADQVGLRRRCTTDLEEVFSR